MKPTSPQAQQLLEQLHDIRAPDPVGWWPLAPGWWVLIALVVIIAAVLAYTAFTRHRKNRYSKEALQLLGAIASSPKQHSVADVNEVLKRTALYAYPTEKSEIAGLHGRAWVQWLNSHCTEPVILDGAADTLIWGAYSGGDSPPLDELLAAARQWVRKHKRGSSSRRGSDA